MKTFLFALMAGFIPALVATNGAYAQNSANAGTMESKNVSGIEKVVTASNDQLVDMAATSPKALKNFAKAYKNVNGESWEKIKDGFSAKFVSNGVTSRIYFDTRGRWTGSLKGYSEDKMPGDVRNIVKREYYDYTITYVQEVETIESNGNPTYVIHLEDNDSIKLVRIFDGQMEVWQEFKKHS